MTNIDPSPRTPSSEAGSAYLATLLVLVVLTLLGLSLAVITQTEVLIGASEKQAVRQVYAAGAGVQNASVFELISHDTKQHRFSITQRTENILGGNVVIGDDVCTSAFHALNRFNCNLCSLNDEEYKAVQYGVTVVALRRGDATLGAKRFVGATVVFDPWQAALGGQQEAPEERLVSLDGDPTTMDSDSSTEVDPCEGLFLKI